MLMVIGSEDFCQAVGQHIPSEYDLCNTDIKANVWCILMCTKERNNYFVVLQQYYSIIRNCVVHFFL